MPFSYQIDRGRALVTLTYGTDQPTIAQWRGVMDAVLGDPGFLTGMAFVSDRRRLIEAPSTAMIRQMAAYEYDHREQFGTCRWAVVTDQAALAEFGMARMSQAVLEGGDSRIELRPFTDMDKAVQWATTGVLRE